MVTSAFSHGVRCICDYRGMAQSLSMTDSADCNGWAVVGCKTLSLGRSYLDAPQTATHASVGSWGPCYCPIPQVASHACTVTRIAVSLCADGAVGGRTALMRGTPLTSCGLAHRASWGTETLARLRHPTSPVGLLGPLARSCLPLAAGHGKTLQCLLVLGQAPISACKS